MMIRLHNFSPTDNEPNSHVARQPDTAYPTSSLLMPTHDNIALRYGIGFARLRADVSLVWNYFYLFGRALRMEEYDRLKELVEAVADDIRKATGGNKAAGTRVRKAMQDIKEAAQSVRKKILEVRSQQPA